MLRQIVPPALTVPVEPVDSLGCSTKKLHNCQDIIGDGIKFYRRRTDDTGLGQVATPGSDRGFLIGISLRPGHSRRIFHEHHSSAHDFDANSVYVRSFADDYLADLKSPFDFLLLEISRDSFDRAVDERMGRRIRSLECVTGLHDPVLSGLGAALLPALAQPRQASKLFVEQMGAVIETHLIEQYGGGLASAPRRARALSRENERRAKDMLLSRLDGASSIADIAAACSLSRSHFIRAFRETTGQPPHQWLLGQRMERARQLLSESATPLAEIAFLCGFSDQSHFTRAFFRATGATPGKWQRSIRT